MNNITAVIKSPEHEDIRIENSKCMLVIALDDDGARAGLFGTASGDDVVNMIYAIGLTNPNLRNAFAAAVAIRLADTEPQYTQTETKDNVIDFPKKVQ